MANPETTLISAVVGGEGVVQVSSSVLDNDKSRPVSVVSVVSVDSWNVSLNS